jgi:hypothetical protein
MNDYQDFSSLPQNAEQEFVPFERHSRESARSAKVIGIAIGGVFLVLALILDFSHTAKESALIEDMKADEEAVKSDLGPEKAPTPTPAPAAAAAPAPAPATAPAADPAAAAAPAPAPAEAPAPAPAAQ